MTFGQLFNLALKLMGVYLAVTAIGTIIALMPSLWYSLLSNELFADSSSTVIYILSILLTAIVYPYLCWELIFGSEKWSRRLLSEELSAHAFDTFTIHRSTVISIVVILLGAWILIDQIPVFLINAFQYITFRESSSMFNLSFGPNPEDIYLPALKILIGLFMVYYNRLIVSWVEKKRRRSGEVRKSGELDGL